MPTPLRLGIIGLGRRWRRWQPALTSLAGEAVVRAVCDPSAARAERAARLVGSRTAAGPIDLLERDEVDAVLLLDRRWFGLWPLGPACRVGKPILCVPSLMADDAHAEQLRDLIEASRLPVMMAMTTALAPAMDRLAELLCGRLGAAQFVRGQRILSRAHGRPLQSGAALELVHAAALLTGMPPLRIGAQTIETRSFVNLLLEFGEERIAQLTLWRGARRGWRMEATTGCGYARIDASHRLRWRDADGLHLQRLPRRPSASLLLQRFVAAVRQRQPLWPAFSDAYRVLSWLRLARRSLEEGRAIAVTD
jgi:predicted dehydrogenase